MVRLVLLILDGLGVAPRNAANPQTRAATPTLDRLEHEAFAITLQASGIGVGLPWGEPGNSEVGHLTIGAGRLLYHHLPRIVNAIHDGSFFENEALRGAFAHVRKTGGHIHVMGLISSGSVHAYIDHLYALFELAEREGMPLTLHVFTDGRDAGPYEAGKLLPQIEERMRALNVGRIATLCGRTFAMDRDGHWDKTEWTYRLLTQAVGDRASSVSEALQRGYDTGATDDVFPPTVIVRSRRTRPPVVDSGDALIFLNFREDSARQLAETFGAREFTRFPRAELDDLFFVTMTEYTPELQAHVAFPPIQINQTLGETLSRAGLSQIRIAESEKYAHTTYFFNGLVEEPFPREERMLIPSLPHASVEQAPEMRAPEIADAVVQAIDAEAYEVIIVNFANADMAGHTGDFEVCVRALEKLDQAVGRVVHAVEQRGDVHLFITADHGNVEEKIDLITGNRLTKHTLNPVPFFAVGPGITPSSVPFNPAAHDASGLLVDVAPTVLAILGIEKPEVMTGKSLLDLSG